MKKIVFLLPGHGNKPVGGHKVVYEYANRFSDLGHQVAVVYGASCLFSKMSLYQKCYSILRFLYFRASKKYYPYGWFDLNKEILIKYTWNLSEKHVTSDIVFATSMETAIYLNQYKKIKKSNKYYFLQDFEYWNWGKEEALKTWYFDLNLIVISPWLKKIGDELNLATTLIENGFDFNLFGVDNPIVSRNRHTIVMLYHKLKSKGSKDGIEAFKSVKAQFPSLKVILFGTSKRPSDLPVWYEYYQLPNKETLRFIYNQGAIYAGTSHTEGWGLTIGEAMQCGCAVVCTDNDGYTIMAKNEDTALVSPINSPAGIAHNIIRLINDDDLRIRIANRGFLNIQNFTWDKSFKKLVNKVIENKE